MPDATEARDDYLNLTEAAKAAPGRPHANAVWRWCRDGVVGRNGERVWLQHIRLGKRMFTTRAWIEEFGAALAEADAAQADRRGGEPATRQGGSSRRRYRRDPMAEHERARAALEKEGL